MKKSLLLSLTSLLIKISAGLIILSFLYMTWLLISYHVSSENFGSSHLNISRLFGGHLGVSIQEVFQPTGEDEPAHPFALKSIKPISLYLIYLQFSAMSLCFILVLKESVKVIHSVKRLESFKKGNVRSFKRMGKYSFFIFLLSGFALVVAENGHFRGVFFNFTAFLLMAVFYVMAEIFKEGSALQEEVQNTI